MAETGNVAEVKGVAVRGALDYIRDKKGDAGVQQTISRLSDPAREQFSRPILATAFYPVPWLIELLESGVEVLGGKTEDVLYDMGSYACRQAMTGVYKIFVKLGSTDYVMKKASQVFNTYFRGLGDCQVAVVEQDKGFARIEMSKMPGGSSIYCRRLDGYYSALLELSGAKDIKVTHTTCAHRGAEMCEWKATWN